MRAWCLTGIHRPVAIPYHPYSSRAAPLRRRRRQLPSNQQLLKDVYGIKGASLDGNLDNIQPIDTACRYGPSENEAYQLPQSPLTDPKLNAARFGHKQPKPAKKEPSQFQLELRKNPYAQALSSPLRQCLLTGAHLPRAFLLQFGLATHPETGEQWQMPNLAAEISPRELQDGKHSANSSNKPANSEHENRPPATRSGLPSRTLSGTHILSDYQALRYMSKIPASKYRSMLPFRWRESGAIKNREVVWREDMPDFTLDLMRKEIIELIESLANKKTTMYLAPCEDWRAIEQQRPFSAVLCPRGSPKDSILTEGVVVQASDLGRRSWTTVNHRGKPVPVYFLEMMLGKGHVRLLREAFPGVLGKDFAVVRKKNMTLRLQMKLWKLAGFLA